MLYELILLDKFYLELKLNHKLVVTLEDGCLDGGYGEKISRFYSTSDIKVLNYGAEKEFTDRIPLDKLYAKYGLDKNSIASEIVRALKK